MLTAGYSGLEQGWENIFYVWPYLKLFCYRGPHIYYAYLIYNV